MSDDKDEFPRDLRGLCGGFEMDSDGTYRVLLDPVNAYANAVAVRRELEQIIEDPETHSESIPSLRKELEFVKREESGLKQRITNHFTPRRLKSGINDNHPFPKIDHGAQSKALKALEEIEAGTYDYAKKSKTLQAVRAAMAFSLKNGSMPSQTELKGLGFNDQQAADAGRWLAEQKDPEPDEHSLFQPLDKPKRGRPKKN